MSSIAVIGFGCAAMNAISAVRQCGCGDEIHVFSGDTCPPSNPMLTTYYVSGKLPYEGMFPFGNLEEIAEKYALTIHGGCPVTAIVPETMSVTAGEISRTFDKILLATGAEAVVPPLGVTPGRRVMCMRTVHDADAMKEFLENNEVSSALVVGASMVGVKILELLTARGVHCTLADMADRVFPLSAFPSVSEKIEGRLTDLGVDLRFGCSVSSAQETENSVICQMSEGPEVQADILVLCVGTRANTLLAKNAGLKVARGICVDSSMATSHPGIYAAGDCCETVELINGTPGIIGLWANAAYQGQAAGFSMAGKKAEFSGNLIHNITHFMGMDFISIGNVDAPGVHRSAQNRDGSKFAEVVIDGGRILCVNLLDSYGVSGVVRNYMMRCVSQGSAPMDAPLRAMLAREGFDDEFLSVFQGGDQQ